MKAVGYFHAGKSDVLSDLEMPEPQASGHDLLIEVRAVAVNPIDCIVRSGAIPRDKEINILGWDAAGIVRKVGDQVSLFKVGDAVWYAGDLSRQGCNSEYHLVDERIAALKPTSLNFAQAAALPLTSLTAWELLFDRLQINREDKSTLLITGAAGGVGSILVQLAKQLTSLKIIATASRPESQKWVKDNGADWVIDHNQPLLEQLQAKGIEAVDYVISLTHTDQHAEQLIQCLKPQGKFALIDSPKNVNFNLFKLKSISIHWEMMFTRSMFKTEDMIQQHHILTQVAKLVDEGKIKTTLTEELGRINAKNLQKAHDHIESTRSMGKLVLQGF